jgi:SanA protein
MRFLIKIALTLSILVILGVVIVNYSVKKASEKFIYSNSKDLPNEYTAIVLGALVSKTGHLSDFLQDRLDAAIDLYNQGKIKRFLLSGDHGYVDYDEVNAMRFYLIDKGINTEDIFLDHAGFDTYNSMIRAKKIFQVQDAIIVSQRFHLPRAVYIARKLGLNAYGYVADKKVYNSHLRLSIREYLANVKAFVEIMISKNPRFLGSKIPITGDSKLSNDKYSRQLAKPSR